MMSSPMQIGVCYYPEHWPESQWAQDAQRMRDLGISIVRIGEFSWSRLEPSDGHLDLEWLQRAVDGLANTGLNVVLGTPTATPPKWLMDKYPDILAVDESGTVRNFGSRRHYCFSSLTYRLECQRIVQILAKHFGQHNAVVAWQTDNEYGCHDTILSYSDAARDGFRQWCKEKYGGIEKLNRDWGNVFWSMEYNNFEQIELPNNTVTEPNPAHSLNFWYYSTDQVQAFNKLQTDILREHSPGRDMVHNFMGNFTAFDHHQVAQDLDVATWDNYPLGFLDRDGEDSEDQKTWLRTGHPDSSAFHHDLYRGVGRGRWWVMEQQPGPVNWAPHNPSPADGMIRLWGLEAMAHGAEVMSYFRWRQFPAAQEQLHTGLCLPNGELDTAALEIKELAKDIQKIRHTAQTDKHFTAKVALVFDYAGDQIQRLLRIGGSAHDPLAQVQSIYSACRQLGTDVDILPATADLTGYKLVLITNVMLSNSTLVAALKNTNATIILFPGTGSRTTNCTVPDELAPGEFVTLINLCVTRSESLPDFVELTVATDEDTYTAKHWRERIKSELDPSGKFDDGWGFHYHQDNVHYLNAHLDQQSLVNFIRARCADADVATASCQDGLRFRTLGDVKFAFNYGPGDATLSTSSELIIGQRVLPPAGVAAWRV